MNSKAQSAFTLMYKVVFGTIAMIVITMIFMGLVSLVYSYKGNVLQDPEQVTADTIAYRFTHSSDCFAYINTAEQTVTPSIDITKFNTDQLNVCYPVTGEKDYEKYNFKLILKSSGQEIKSANYYEAPDFTLYYTIPVHENDAWTKDTITIYVQKPFKDKPLNGRLNP